MNRHLCAEAFSSNSRVRQAFCKSVLSPWALAFVAVLLPTAFAGGAVLPSDIQTTVLVRQIDAVLPRTVLLATAPQRVLGIAAVTQLPVAGRLTLHTPVLKPGQGPVQPAQGLNLAACADEKSRVECGLLQEWGPDGRVATAADIDPVSGAAQAPGVSWNPPSTRAKLDEVLTDLASAVAKPVGLGLTSTSPKAHVGTTYGAGNTVADGTSTSFQLIPTTVFNMNLLGDYNTVTVDLMSANAASWVTGLTLSSHNTLLLLTAPGGTLQLNNVTLATGSPAQQSRMTLSSALNGFISVLGGATDGTGITKVANVKALSVLQNGGPHIVLQGLNGTVGTVTMLLQSGTPLKTLHLDNETNDMVIHVRQTGNTSHTATGIVLKAGSGSSFVLRQL